MDRFRLLVRAKLGVVLLGLSWATWGIFLVGATGEAGAI